MHQHRCISTGASADTLHGVTPEQEAKHTEVLLAQVSSAMGFGFRCGFLGLLHMEIVQERLEREYDLDLIITAPTVVYRAMMTDGEEVIVDNPCLLPDAARREYISEPYVRSAPFSWSAGQSRSMLQNQRTRQCKCCVSFDERVCMSGVDLQWCLWHTPLDLHTASRDLVCFSGQGHLNAVL